MLFKYMPRFTLIIIVLFGTFGCQDSDEKDSKTRLKISGAFALYPMVVRWAEEYQKTHENVEFDITAGGAGKGMTDVLNGVVDLAMVSREIRREELEQGAYGIGVTKDAVVAVANADNPSREALVQQGLTPEKAASIWLVDNPPTWGVFLGTENDDRITVYTRSDSSGAAEMWSKYAGGSAQEDLKGIAVQGDPGLAEAVRQDRLGIGFNNIGFAYDLNTSNPVVGLQIIPLDLNGDGEITADEDFYATLGDIVTAIADGRYPSPPARVLYLVTNGKPNSAEADFIRWILTDGQQFVREAGYVALPAEQLQAGLSQLENQ